MSPPIIENESDRLASVYSLSVLDTPPEPRFDELVELAAWTCHAPISALALVAEDRQWFKASVGLGMTETSREISFCAHTIAEASTLVVADTHLDDRFRENPLVTGDSAVRFYAGVPLMVDDGMCVGTLCVLDTRPRAIFADERRALEILARQVEAQLRADRLEWTARDTLTSTLTPLAATRWLVCQDTATTRAALHVDIKGLADMNDHSGRKSGDWILSVTGARLVASAPQGATVVRLHDDKFVVLLPDVDPTGLYETIERLRISLEAPIGDTSIAAAFGLATARPGNAGDDLIEAAARATHLEKQLRRT